MRLCVYALLYQLSSICYTSYHYINHWFIHLLYMFCMMYVVRMWQGNIVLRSISCVTKGYIGCNCTVARWEKFPFVKEYKNEIFHYFILTFGLLQKNVTMCPFWRVAKIIHIESFKENISSIGMSCAIVWFRRVHLQKQPPETFLKKGVLKNSVKFTENTCAWVFFLALLFFLVRGGEMWLGGIHQLFSVGRLL